MALRHLWLFMANFMANDLRICDILIKFPFKIRKFSYSRRAHAPATNNLHIAYRRSEFDCKEYTIVPAQIYRFNLMGHRTHRTKFQQNQLV